MESSIRDLICESDLGAGKVDTAWRMSLCAAYGGGDNQETAVSCTYLSCPRLHPLQVSKLFKAIYRYKGHAINDPVDLEI